MSHTPEQKAAIEFTHDHLRVVAGAGSGKTRVLVNRIIHLLETRQARLSDIVAITFTRKAAEEMKKRLRAECRSRASQQDSHLMTFWRDAERDVETARVTTIDAFCASVLRENALALDLDPEFTMLAEAETRLLQEDSAQRTLLRLLEAEHPHAVALATEHGFHALYQTLVRNLARSGWDEIIDDAPWEAPEAYAMKVSSKAVSSLKSLFADRARRLGEFEGKCLDATTPRELQRVAQLQACMDVANSTTDSQIREAVTGIIQQKFGRGKKKNWSSEQVYDDLKKLQDETSNLIGLVDTLLNKATPPDSAAILGASFAAMLKEALDDYRAAKTARVSMDFTDLLATTRHAIAGNSQLRGRIAGGIKYLLIDEFQDTNPDQWSLAQLLMDTGSQQGAHVFIVGDAKQSIYRFRDADVSVFQDAGEALGATRKLQENFRTLPNVMNFINDFFESSGLLHAVEPDYTPLQPHRQPVSESCVEFLIPDVAEKLPADEARAREASLIAAHISALCAPDSAARVYDDSFEDGQWQRTARPVTPGDIAILFRSKTNYHIYESAISRLHLPTRILTGANYYAQQEIADMRNLLATAVNPWDDASLLAFLRSPLSGLDDNSIYQLNKQGGLPAAFNGDAALPNSDQQTRLCAARDLVRSVQTKRDLPLPALLRHILQETAFEAILLAQYHGEQKAGNVRKLIDIAADFSHTGSARLLPFIRYMDDLTKQEIREGEADLFAGETGAITLMTIHNAKGLEFPVVYVVDSGQSLSQGNNTSCIDYHRDIGLVTPPVSADGKPASTPLREAIRTRDKHDELAEHARILYVALTRAQDRLVISGVPNIAKDGPKAGKNSWLQALHQTYNVLHHDHGESIQRPGWAAGICRTMEPPPTTGTASSPEDSSLNYAALAKQAAPVEAMHFETVSVSDFLKTTEVEASDDTFRGNADALIRGTILHRLLELWDFENNQHPEIPAILRSEFAVRSEDPALLQDLKETLQRFGESDLFSRLHQAPSLEKEVPFVLRLEAYTLTGTIDAILPDGTIVDYKTGRPNPSLSDKYHRQICIYAAALKTIRGSAPTKGLIYYLDVDECVEIDLENVDLDDYLKSPTS